MTSHTIFTKYSAMDVGYLAASRGMALALLTVATVHLWIGAGKMEPLNIVDEQHGV